MYTKRTAGLLGMYGCGQTKEHTPAKLTRVVLERGHGSMWGNQFYIDVCPQQINQAQFFPTDLPEYTLREGIPIRQEDWKAIEAAVRELEPNLKEEKRQKKPDSIILDGGEFHKLTLTWEQDGKTQEKAYRWPTDSSAEKLEQLLENMVAQLA